LQDGGNHCPDHQTEQEWEIKLKLTKMNLQKQWYHEVARLNLWSLEIIRIIQGQKSQGGKACKFFLRLATTGTWLLC
jgi:hypothetical protein